MNRIITIIASVLLLFAAAPFVSAQNGYEVKGVVADQSGPIIGATVIEQGTTNGTVTGLDGDYVLKVSGPQSVVEISCIGYKTISFIASQAAPTYTLVEDAEFLDDVVVIGYGTVKKSDMTGSVVAIKAEELNRGAVTSPSALLTGKVSGLLVTPPSGQPGAGATIRIRGAASLNASNDPLIVIDGVPVTKDGGAGMGDPLASVNPNDIESYTVLKDASATAIYGSRASNGVIIITTKKGKGNDLRVTYNGSVSVKQNSATIDMMNAEQLRKHLDETYPGNSTVQSLVNLYDADTDWQKQIYRLAVNTDHNISIYGGGKVLPFRVSAGYNLDQATLKTGDNQRANLDMSLSPKFFDEHLSVNANLKGVWQGTNWANDGAIGNALSFDPTKPIRNEKGQYWNWYNADGTANTMASTNPLSNLYDYTNIAGTLRSIGNLQLDYKIHGLEDLRLNLNLGYDVAKTDGRKFNEVGSISALRDANDRYYQYTNFNKNTLLEAYANYNHTFSNDHNLDVMAGYSWQHNYVKYDETQFINNDFSHSDKEIYQIVPTNAKEYYLISFFGRINWSIKSRYLFTVTVREDASSRFSKKNRWGFFPSAAFAWNIANENWLKGSKAVSALKLRLGWGQTGQQDIGDDYYPYLARYVESSNLAMQYMMNQGKYSYTLAPQAYNPNLKWETTTTYNVGLDFGFINDRITGSVEAYYRDTKDLLNFISAPLGSNFSNSIISNIGGMMNRGIELSLNFVPVETEDWHWSIGGNVTFQDTKITKLTAQKVDGYLGVTTGAGMGGTGGYTSLHREGFAPYTFYLFEQLYDKDGAPVQNALVDRDSDGRITDADRYVTGYSPTPDVYFGINTQLRWKNWDLGLNGHGSIGNYAINCVRQGFSSSYSDDYKKGYINNLSNDFLVPGWKNANENNQKYSDLFVENASFFKIDDINLGYTFNINKCIQSLRVAASVQNVCVFTKYSGLDPELLSSDGVDNNIIPRPRLYTVRLSVNF